MTGLGCWLLVIGLCDLFRAARDLTSLRRRFTLVGAGLGLVAVASVASQPEGVGAVAWGLGAVGFVGWVVASSSALGPGTTRGGVVAAAYGSLLLGVLGFVLVDERAGSPAGVEGLVERSALGGVTLDALVLVAGVLLVQLSTANVAIRLLLDLVGVPAADNEKQLKGGRVLGPMERLVIVGFGLAGSLTGAALVVAAKALLRFPELRSSGGGSSPVRGASDVTEYFLVGSFASWLVALGGVALASGLS